MKVSEVIVRLTNMMAKHGDCELSVIVSHVEPDDKNVSPFDNFSVLKSFDVDYLKGAIGTPEEWRTICIVGWQTFEQAETYTT